MPKNRELLESSVNKTFEDILWMTEEEFCSWVKEMRQVVVDLWDNGLPPRVGFSEEEMQEQFRLIQSFPVANFLVRDELTGEKNVIRNTSVVGNACNDFFPTMMKTKINYTSDVSGGLSIYDHFKDPDLLEKMITYGRRHFKRDSFYHYSTPVRANDPEYFYMTTDAKEWISKFEDWRDIKNEDLDYDYWLSPKEAGSSYSGYDDKLRNIKFLRLTKKDLAELGLRIPDKCKTNLSYNTEAEEFQIRLFKKGQKIFPIGLKAFRISVCQYAVNFPPLTAKYLYQRYTQYLPNGSNIVVWDPSSGWGGRILGAMGTDLSNKTLHYIGTDPNTDHNTTPGRTKYHELADFYNQCRNSGLDLGESTHTYEIYQCGSEVMKDQEDFQKYKGKLDLVFTSPPYFAKEVYSKDPEQSAIKFSNYDSWVEGFLKPTLRTAVEWLKPGGFVLWNIADVKFGPDMLPLEKTSNDILKSLDMEYIETLKMCLSRMPGGNRIDADGTPLAKNFCLIHQRGSKEDGYYKFEPIFVWRKPC